MLRQRWGYGPARPRRGKGRGNAEGVAGLAPFPDHYDGRRFFNPHAPDGKRFRVVRRWQPTRGQKAWPERVEDPSFPPPIRAANDVISVTFIGHSTFLLQAASAYSPIRSGPTVVVLSRLQAHAERGDPDRPWAHCPAWTCFWCRTTITTIWICRRCARCEPDGRHAP